MYVLMNHTRIGAHLYAIGGNPQAARLNGINTGRLIALVLVLTALSTTVASILLSGRQLAAGPIISALGASSSGSLASPASPLVAALFAGVALSGGEGRVERTLLGVLFLATLSIGMAIVNLPVYMRISIEGIASVLAILLDSLRRRIETR
jgi:ribose/xylose/arabinose/galactoside ABC-type transport system permease subunit